MAACRTLGWTEVPVRIAERVSVAAALLRAERDENTCRLDMKPSEKARLGMALEAIERPKAKERQTATLKQGDGARPSAWAGDWGAL